MKSNHTNRMQRRDIFSARLSSVSLAIALAGSTVYSAELLAASNALKDLTVNQLPGNRTEVVISFEEDASAPRGFTVENPARIALDFQDTQNDLTERMLTVDSGQVRNIKALEFQGRTRLVVSMTQLAPYTTTVNGNTVSLIIEPAAKTAEVETATGSIRSQLASVERSRELENIDFRRGTDGEGRVTFNLTDPNTPVDIRQQGTKVLIDLKDVSISDEELKRLDVIDFATPVKYIDTYRRGRNVRVEIEPMEGVQYEQLAYQSDRIFTLELRPITLEDGDDPLQPKVFEGQKLSLNFQDIAVRSVLQLLAEFTEQNVVVSDSVEGNVTLRLKNVPWDQALDIILKSKGLDMRSNGNVVMVAPAAEIAAREQLELEAATKKHELATLHTEIMQVNYAKAADIAEMLQGEEATILSDRGTVTVDERTNTLLVNDTAEQLVQIRVLVNELDVPVRQVLIESRVVVASDDFNKEIGARLGLTTFPQNTTDGYYGITSGNLGAVENVFNTTIGGEDETINAPDRWNVNLPASNPTGSIGFEIGKLPFGGFLELELSAMEAEGRGEIVSSPRVITANQKEAYIEQGVEVPYLEASSSGAASISFKKAILGMKVTPQITPDDRIIMDLTVNKDSVGEFFGSGASRVPSIDTREVNTQVLVENGETVVLGGIYEQVRNSDQRKVPLLGNLPVVGRLFRYDSTRDEKNELLIFVTPKIIGQNTVSR
ncbi:MAG: type IV pilus secretin PilQ [Pseudomonadota bacterium]